MGYETTCAVRVEDASRTVREAKSAKVLLETDDLIVRGNARVSIPRASITSVTTRSGVVTVKSLSATIRLTLGDDAARWTAKLSEPPKRTIDKLDVKPDARVWMWHLQDSALAAQILERAPRTTSGRSARDCDVVFVGVDSTVQLDRIERAAAAIANDGAIWVVHPKGKSGVADVAIFAHATALGLTYTKVARISDTLSAEKLVWPRATRAARAVRAINAAESAAPRRAPAPGG